MFKTMERYETPVTTSVMEYIVLTCMYSVCTLAFHFFIRGRYVIGIFRKYGLHPERYVVLRLESGDEIKVKYAFVLPRG